MKGKNCLIFGGSGQIGRNLIRKLTKNEFRVTVVTRNIHQKSYIIKTQANAGYIDVIEANIFDEKKLRNLFLKNDICINLIGILFEQKKGNTFKNIHTVFPSLLAKLSKEYNLKHFIHLSALGINEALDSNYAQSKLQGENEVLKNFPLATILRPSVVYSVDDNFTTNFMTLLNRLPFFPLYYKGNTRFSPIHCTDMAEIISTIIEKNINSQTIECIGPEQITFKEIVKNLLESINKKRIVFPMPMPIAKIQSTITDLLPFPPILTKDQCEILSEADNVVSDNNLTLKDLDIEPSDVEEEMKKWLWRYKDGGQFAKA